MVRGRRVRESAHMASLTPNTHFTVFLVEDSSLIRDRVTTLLARCEGVELIGSADSVQAAIDGIEALQPDALIVDLKIIGGTGFDVLEALHPAQSGTRVAIMTNWPTEQYRQAGLALGAEYLLDKSTEFARLPKILAEWASDARTNPPRAA